LSDFSTPIVELGYIGISEKGGVLSQLPLEEI
jgi:hypothetical protein